MYKPRIIPVLLLKDSGLVKSVKFKNHNYIGDPINAVKIFNDLRTDELVFLDIEATKQNRCISIDFVKLVCEEANMPFSVGGGINSIEQIRQILEAGAEKVILNTIAGQDLSFIKKASDEFGSSAIGVCIDVKKNLFGKNVACIMAGKKTISFTPKEFAVEVEKNGAGEIILQSIENDGKMLGYDIELIKEISDIITIPITVVGGAGKLEDIKEVLNKTTINGFGAGSLFVYHGARKGILINYPSEKEKETLLRDYVI